MKIPIPRQGGNNGWYGGAGSRPAHKAWTPGGSSSPQRPPERVPKRFRRLRLRRRTRSSVAPDSASTVVLLVFFAIIFVVFVLTRIF